MHKYETQGFRLEINIDEKETVYHVPLHAVAAVYKNDNNFYLIKNFTVKNYLGDDIEVDYNQPKLTFKTNNNFGAFGKWVYNKTGYVPVVGTVRDIYELTEGAIQENNEQLIDGGIDVALDIFTFGFGKLTKAPIKAAEKAIVKGAAKSAVKQTAKKQLSKVVIENISNKYNKKYFRYVEKLHKRQNNN